MKTKLLKTIGFALQVLGVVYIFETAAEWYLLGHVVGLPHKLSANFNSGSETTPDILVPRSGMGWPDEEKAAFNKRVLESMNIKFTEQVLDGVYWVRWSPQDEELEKEIHARVDQFGFVRDVCPELPIPKPDQPSKKKLSCKSNPDWYEP